MIEFNQGEAGEAPDAADLSVKVIGVGGAGANVLDRMALEGSDDAELLTLNTDVRALTTSVSSDKIQLGSTLLKGMGTGGDPSLGKQAALEAVDEIRDAVRGRQMVFVCVGLGGGTGSGAGPEVCRIVREEGVFLVVFATMPFSFEGERRMEQAKEALALIGSYANAVITFENDRMGELIVPKDGVTQAFAAADKIISQSIRATMSVVSRPGIIRIGMDDLLSALDSPDSRCLFGYGIAKGDNRSHEAVEQALKCPLLDRGKLLEDAEAVLVQVAGGENMTLFEVQLVMEEVSKHVRPETQILFGTGTDPRLASSLSVTIISSIPGPGAEEVVPETVTEAEPAPVSLGGAVSVEESTPILAAVPPEEPMESADEESPLNLAVPADSPVADLEVEAPEFPETEDDVIGLPEFADEPGEEEGDESAVYEPIADEEEGLIDFNDEEEETPSYAPQPVPTGEEEAQKGDQDEMVNPIAQAMDQGREEHTESVAPISPIEGKARKKRSHADHVEAVTESSQKIKLTRMVSSGNTGKIKTRAPGDESGGPILPPTKPPALPPETLEPSEEAKQQQELLQLEPVAGKGRFAKSDPTIVDGEDLDVPTFLRKKK
ncbi:MAG: hypothetical protein AAGC68_06910 [Verrucomicrobiota bacterium]